MILNLVLITVLVMAVYHDLRERKIPNRILIAGFGLAVLVHGLSDGWQGVFFSIRGLLVGLGLFFLPFLLDGIGAGDVKLLGVIGALQGSSFVFYTFLAAALIGGLLSCLVLLKNKQLKTTLMRVGMILWQLYWTRFSLSVLQGLRSRDNDYRLPYALAIALGAFVVAWMR
ncbi:peptidase A24A prepilin type IV [Calderihabitans maritimus]|uniref:Peptidase A24A prepilin type IV n=2 Tax=Calderihabitans maritimus TaxID=1246530 RepID=A0A1Z5HU38_9FIRM|nr:peptidase A24A prepilin type IV [Calderihabitans maritimus]